MPLSARIERDSISPAGHRLTTFVCTYPRMLLCEVNAHRALSRNTASSRAIPLQKTIERVMEDPFIPWHWGANRKGMTAGDPLDLGTQEQCKRHWLKARNNAVETVSALEVIGLHKQVANRLLEPFMWVTSVITGTDWSNFFSLRCHLAAEPHFADLAFLMADLYYGHEPDRVGEGKWHLPFILEDELDDPLSWWVDPSLRSGSGIPQIAKISAARCARVSYLTHEGVRSWERDLELYDKLTSERPAHASPLEHVAYALPIFDHFRISGNFSGWEQLRKRLPGETDTSFNQQTLAHRRAERRGSTE